MKSNIFYYLLPFTLLFVGCNSDSDKFENQNLQDIDFPIDEFKVSINNDTTIFGRQGTRIFIPKGIFETSDGIPINDSIDFSLMEFYKLSDIALAQLSTESNGELLLSAGMVKLKAAYNGEELKIKDGKKIVVHIPKRYNFKEKMDLFYGDQNSTDSSVTNWQVDTVNLIKSTLIIANYAWWHPSFDDSTSYNFIPKNFVDTGYYVNPLDFYLNSFNFTEATKKEIETTQNISSYSTLKSWDVNGVECEMGITRDGYVIAPKVNTAISASAKAEIIAFLKNIPQLEPGKDKYGAIIPRRGLLFIQGGRKIPIYKTSEEYLKSFNAKYAEYENQPIRNVDDAEFEYYVFSVSKLGWINADIFSPSVEKVDYLVDLPYSNTTTVKMVFKDLNSVLIGTEQNGKYQFKNVPKERAITLIVYKNEGGFLTANFINTKTTNKPLSGIVLNQMTLSDFRMELEKLN